MKRHILSFFTLLFAVTITAQTLNVVTGNVTYAFPASKVGDMTCTDGTTLTIGGKVFAINDINKIYVDNSEVTDNEVAVLYNGTTASLTVAGNVAPYVIPAVSGAHVSIAQSNTADVDGNEITYTLSGASSDGEFYISGKYKCSIELNGLSLTNKTPVYSGAALHVQNGKRINVSVKKGTENTLTDCSSPSEDLAQKAALYVKGHAEFKGKGTLNVKGQYKHAIKAGEYISVKNCTLNVTGAVSDGVNCNQYFLMESGSISMNGVGDDGIQCDIDEDADATGETTDHEDENSGNIYLTDGTIAGSVTATASKGLNANGKFIASGGAVTISTSGGGEWDSDNAKTKASACISADDDINISGGTFNLTSTGAGGKGISGDGTFIITGGDITINTSGGIAYYSGGKISTTTSSQTTERLSSNYKSSPKGIKTDGAMTLSGGTLNVKASCHEAIETKGALDITDGVIYTQSSDDAINSGGVMTISGGTVCAYSTGNDGLDANANLTIKGGTIYAIGATSPEVGIDAMERCTLTVSGGTLVAIGGLESGAVTTQTCYQLSSSTTSSSGTNGRGGFFPGQQGGNKTWTANTWYGLYSNGTLALAFKTPSSGGSALVVSTSGTTTLKTGVTAGSDTFWNGMGATSATNGTSASITTYSSGNGWR